jgi:hypothetical protein
MVEMYLPCCFYLFVEKFVKAFHVPNKALKHVQRVALNWTPATGAASQYRAGFSRRLALR